MSWQSWIYVVPEPHPLTHRSEQVEGDVMSTLAQALETRLRGRIDRGIDLRTGARAQAIRVAADGNRMVIDEGADHGVAGARGRSSTIEDLFHTSMAAPLVLEDGRVALRAIDEDHLFGAQASNDELVDHVAEEVVRERLVDAVEQAVRKVALEHPGDRSR
jgi:hypothetical protein